MTTQNEYIEVYAEATPNPETMKFVFNKMIAPGEAFDFPTPDNTHFSPLAKNLFEFNFVNGVFIMNNFVTITRAAGSEWNELIPIVKEFLKSYISSGEPVIIQKQTENSSKGKNLIEAQIIEILDTYVKPAVETDGGMISFKSFEPETGKVVVELKGSCSGCPSSTVTLKRGIEGMLTKMVPDVKEVVAESL
ncbi:MAG: NifU family protein [Bacteroidia bacterium]